MDRKSCPDRLLNRQEVISRLLVRIILSEHISNYLSSFSKYVQVILKISVDISQEILKKCR